jgi:hypothetical protein
MSISIQGNENCMDIFYARPRKYRNLLFLIPGIAFPSLIFWAELSDWKFNVSNCLMIILGIAVMALFAYISWWRIFGEDRLTVMPDYVALERNILLVRRTTKFPRTDVERLGYIPEFGIYWWNFKNRQERALGLVVRSRVMPVQFAHTISIAEVEQVFSELRQNGSWLAELIRPVGESIY